MARRGGNTADYSGAGPTEEEEEEEAVAAAAEEEAEEEEGEEEEGEEEGEEEEGEEAAGAGLRNNLLSELPRHVRSNLRDSKGWRGDGDPWEGTGRGARARTQVSRADFLSSQGEG